jgi:hypothetical protein
MPELTRITLNPEVTGGKPCIRGMRITVGTVVGLVASGGPTFAARSSRVFVEFERTDHPPDKAYTPASG